MENIQSPRRWVNNLTQQEFLLGLLMALCVGVFLLLASPYLDIPPTTTGYAVAGILTMTLGVSYWARNQRAKCPKCDGVFKYKGFAYMIGEIEACPHCHTTFQNLL